MLYDTFVDCKGLCAAVFVLVTSTFLFSSEGLGAPRGFSSFRVLGYLGFSALWLGVVSLLLLDAS